MARRSDQSARYDGTPAFAYVRVSTEMQDLGLDAQMDMIRRFCDAHGVRLINGDAPFQDKETGGDDEPLEKRPGLLDAMTAAGRAGGWVVVARLDRLSRSVFFITRLMFERVRFVCTDVGFQDDPFMLHIHAAMAERERRLIKQRTSEAMRSLSDKLAALGKDETYISKKSGRECRRLGNPNNGPGAAHAAKGGATIASKADAFARHMAPKLAEYRANGHTSIKALVAALNADRVPTSGAMNKDEGRRFAQWNKGTLSRLIRRIAELEIAPA